MKQQACPGEIHNMLGAAASNDVKLATTLPREQLTMKDAFGRTPLMLAAFFKAYDMLDWLSGQLQGDEWQLDAQYIQKASEIGLRVDVQPQVWFCMPKTVGSGSEQRDRPSANLPVILDDYRLTFLVCQKSLPSCLSHG